MIYTSKIFSLEAKPILVTGASSGIGRSVALACAQAGAQVILHGRDSDRLHASWQALPGSGHQIFEGDLQTQDNVIALADQCPSIHGVVHCAVMLVLGARVGDQERLAACRESRSW